MNVLPNIIFLELCKYLDPSDLISIEKVNKDMNKKVKNKYIWKCQFMKLGGCCDIISTDWFIYKRATFMCKIVNLFATRKRMLIWNIVLDKCHIELLPI